MTIDSFEAVSTKSARPIAGQDRIERLDHENILGAHEEFAVKLKVWSKR